MKKRHLALAAGIVLVLIGLAVAVTVIRPSPALTVRCCKVAVVGDSVMALLRLAPRSFMTSFPFG